MSNHTTTTFDRLTWKLTAIGGSYGYNAEEAVVTAEQILATRTPGWIAAFLGDIDGCSNCGEPAVIKGRCARCRNLASDLF